MIFDFANLPYWILLGSGILLYLFVIFSGGGGDDADIDVDADVDVDVDADADVDADGDFSIASTLGWLGIGKAPLVLLLATDLSLWGLFGWMLNVAVGTPSNWLANIVMGVSGGGAIAAGGLLAQPIGKVFASFGEDASSDRLVGCIGTVSTIRIPLVGEGKVGQVDVLDPARNLVTVNAVLPEWAIAMPQRGDKVVVIDRAAQAYIVIARDSSDQDRWLSRNS